MFTLAGVVAKGGRIDLFCKSVDIKVTTSFRPDIFSMHQNKTRLPSNLMPTTRECVHLVKRRRDHFRSRDNNNGPRSV